MGFFKDLSRVPGLYLSAFSWKKKKKKKKPVLVEVRMDKDTKTRIDETIKGAGDLLTQAAQTFYTDLRDSGQLDRLVSKLGELLAKAGAVIETTDTKTITVAATPDQPHVVGDKIRITGARGSKKAGTVHRRPKRKNEKQPNSGETGSGDGTGAEGNGEPTPAA